MPATPARSEARRPMTSAVYWAVLGLLIQYPGYGAEVFKRYQRRYADVLPVSDCSHIYTAITELVRRGYAEEMPPPRTALAGVGRQPKPSYRATPLGVRSFIDRLVEQAEIERNRHALWVRQLGVFADAPVLALQVLERSQNLYLQKAGSDGKAAVGPAPESRDELVEHLAAKRQRFAGGGVLSWLKYAISTFEARAADAARNDASGT